MSSPTLLPPRRRDAAASDVACCSDAASSRSEATTHASELPELPELLDDASVPLPDAPRAESVSSLCDAASSTRASVASSTPRWADENEADVDGEPDADPRSAAFRQRPEEKSGAGGVAVAEVLVRKKDAAVEAVGEVEGAAQLEDGRAKRKGEARGKVLKGRARSVFVRELLLSSVGLDRTSPGLVSR